VPAVTHGSPARGACRRRREDGEQGEGEGGSPRGLPQGQQGRGSPEGGKSMARSSNQGGRNRRRRRRMKVPRIDSGGGEEEGEMVNLLDISAPLGDAWSGVVGRRPWLRSRARAGKEAEARKEEGVGRKERHCRGDDLGGAPRARQYAGWRPRSPHSFIMRRPAPPKRPAAPAAGWRLHRGELEPSDEDKASQRLSGQK
jgi:hypothetical protein